MLPCIHGNMIYLIGHSKGGVGKSTIATNLAAALALRGSDVLLFDADKQGTSTLWAAERAQTKRAKVPSVQGQQDVRPALLDLRKRYDDIVVDVSGRDSTELRTAMLIADVMAIPTRPSQADLWALDELAQLVTDVRQLNEKLAVYALINMAPHNTSEGRAAREMFADVACLRLAETMLCDRKVYRDAMIAGASVLEMENDKAASELAAFVAEVVPSRGEVGRVVQA